MPTQKVPESAITGRNDGITVAIRVLANDGATARILIEDCGIHVRQGQVRTVPSDQIKHIDDYS